MTSVPNSPVVGVFTTSKQIRQLLTRRPDYRLNQLNTANQTAETCLYFFSMEDVDLVNEKINGTYHNTCNERWERKVFPFPDVIYNRGGVSLKGRAKYNTFVDLLKKTGVKNINHLYGFNKWEVHKTLLHNPETAPLLPDTKLYTTRKEFKKMLYYHNRVYLKACRGRKGQQVMQVARITNGIYEYRYFITRVMVRRVKLRQLFKVMRAFFGDRKFIMQQAIDVPKSDGSVIDLRAELQRNHKGELEIAGISVRVGAKNSPISTHASSYRFEDYFAGESNGSAMDTGLTRATIEDTLEKIYLAMERHYGPLGELGIDFALDQSGRFWLIECNSQPTRVSLMKAYDDDTVLKSFLTPLEYAKFLAAGGKGG